MSEKLTESELIILAERKYDVEFIGARAVAQIRELRAENAKLREAIVDALDKRPTDDSWCIILRAVLKDAAEAK